MNVHNAWIHACEHAEALHCPVLHRSHLGNPSMPICSGLEVGLQVGERSKWRNLASNEIASLHLKATTMHLRVGWT